MFSFLLLVFGVILICCVWYRWYRVSITIMNKRKAAIFQTIAALSFDLFEDDDEMEEEIVYMMLSSNKKEKNASKRKRVCIKNYEEVILQYSMTDFQSHFRLERSTIQVILEQLGKKIFQATSLGGRPSCPQKQLLLSIWMFANQEVYRSVADRFNVSMSTAWEYFQRIVTVLTQVSPDYIKWPDVCDNVKRGFKKRGGIDGVIGAIDGTHIPIVSPTFLPNKYLNRKQYHSIVLQAVCDASYIFTDCFAGCPGSVHDARVYRMSPLYRQIMPGVNGEYHLLGDTAYPNSVNLITPYRDNGYLTQEQKRFNYVHSSTRVFIEQSFGLLKGRFRILKFINVYRTEIIPNIIIACCVLHNICMKNKDQDIEMYSNESYNDQIIDELVPDDLAACSKRDKICEQIVI